MSPPLRASVRLLHPFGAALEAEGCSIATLLDASGLEANVYDDPDARVPFTKVRDFLVAAAKRTKHPALGLEAARQHDRAQFQLLHYLVASSRDVESGVGDLVRFQSLVTDVRFMRLDPCDDGLLLRYDEPVLKQTRLLVDYAVGALAIIVQRALGERPGESEVRGPQQAVGQAWFSYPAPRRSDIYRGFFGPSVRFDAPATGVWFARQSVSMPLPQANVRLCEVLERQAEEQMRRLAAETSFSERVRALIVDNLADPDASLDRIAARLRLSRSTLKRRLAEEGLGYRDLHEAARRKAALDYLGRGLNLYEIALLLGYKDISAFHRAFRRWTGTTPTDYRRRRVRVESG